MAFYYQPGTVDRSGELLAMGVYRGADALGDAVKSIALHNAQVGERREEFEAHANAGKALLAAVKTNPKAYGMDENQLTGLEQAYKDSSLAGKAQFPALLTQMVRMAQEGQAANRDAELFNMRRQQFTQQQADRTALDQYFQANRVGPEPAAIQQLTGDVVTNALTGQNPNVWQQSTPQLLEGFARSNPAAADNLGLMAQVARQGSETPDQLVQFQDTPFAGMKAWRHGNSAGIITDPAVRGDMTDNQKAQLASNLRKQHAESRLKYASLLMASKNPKTEITPEMIAAAADNVAAIEDEMKAYGLEVKGASAPSAPSGTAGSRFKIVEIK